LITEAIKKIKDEMAKEKNSYVKVIGKFLLQHLESNPEDAEKILNNSKTISKSLEEMRKIAKANKVGDCAVLSDQEGFEIVLKYFGINGAREHVLKEVKPSTEEKVKDSSFNYSIDDFLNS